MLMKKIVGRNSLSSAWKQVKIEMVCSSALERSNTIFISYGSGKRTKIISPEEDSEISVRVSKTRWLYCQCQIKWRMDTNYIYMSEGENLNYSLGLMSINNPPEVTLLCPLCRSNSHRKEDWKTCDHAICSKAWNPEQSPRKFHMYCYELATRTL